MYLFQFKFFNCLILDSQQTAEESLFQPKLRHIPIVGLRF